jgi:hypothetical protein
MASNIDHPVHYNSHPSGVECIDIAEHHNFNVGNAIKYLWRAGLKKEQGLSDLEKELEDIDKAIWYLTRHRNNLDNKIKDVKL